MCNSGDTGLIPESGSSPEEGNGNRLQYSCLENSMDRVAWRATHGSQSMGSQNVGHDWGTSTFTEIIWEIQGLKSGCTASHTVWFTSKKHSSPRSLSTSWNQSKQERQNDNLLWSHALTILEADNILFQAWFRGGFYEYCFCQMKQYILAISIILIREIIMVYIVRIFLNNDITPNI